MSWYLRPLRWDTRRVSRSPTVVNFIEKMFSPLSTAVTTKLPDRLLRLLGRETNVAEGTLGQQPAQPQRGGRLSFKLP